jgi:hypothetical protein
VLFLYLLTWTWCSFPVNTALGVALAILRRLNLNEGDSIPTRTLSYLNMTLTASYPPQPSTIDTAFELIKAFHRTIISIPVSLLQPVVFAVQTGLTVWIEDNCVSLSVDQYNDLVRNLSSSPPTSHSVYFFRRSCPSMIHSSHVYSRFPYLSRLSMPSPRSSPRYFRALFRQRWVRLRLYASSR